MALGGVQTSVTVR